MNAVVTKFFNDQKNNNANTMDVPHKSIVFVRWRQTAP